MTTSEKGHASSVTQMTSDDLDTWQVMHAVIGDSELESGIHFALNNDP